MLDYVKRSELEAMRDERDRERELRIRAESDRNNADRFAVKLTEMIDTERRLHHEELETVLKHTAPIAPVELVSGDSPAASPEEMTVEQAMLLPAVGFSQIQAKRELISFLQAREAQSRTNGTGNGGKSETTTPDDELSDVERERVRSV